MANRCNLSDLILVFTVRTSKRKTQYRYVEIGWVLEGRRKNTQLLKLLLILFRFKKKGNERSLPFSFVLFLYFGNIFDTWYEVH